MNINHLSYRREIVEDNIKDDKPYIQLIVQYGEDEYRGKLGKSFLLSNMREIVKSARINEIQEHDKIRHEMILFCEITTPESFDETLNETIIAPFCILVKSPSKVADYDTLVLISKIIYLSENQFNESSSNNFRLLLTKLKISDKFLYQSCLSYDPDKITKSLITFLMKIRITRLIHGFPVWQLRLGEFRKYDNESIIAEYIDRIKDINDAKILFTELNSYLAILKQENINILNEVQRLIIKLVRIGNCQEMISSFMLLTH